MLSIVLMLAGGDSEKIVGHFTWLPFELTWDLGNFFLLGEEATILRPSLLFCVTIQSGVIMIYF